MKKINQQATQTFAGILEKMDGHEHMRLEYEGYMPLVLEKLEENILTPFGVASHYSLAHYNTQGGDELRDPEIGFLVVDNRREKDQFEFMTIYPCYFFHDILGIARKSIRIKDGRVRGIVKSWQADHALFAGNWLKNIKSQGFLKVDPATFY
ncbi:MAG: hypothetical protein P4L51_28240 [Puia sp.]|nr:hypothetical protein [Puia sp.]